MLQLDVISTSNFLADARELLPFTFALLTLVGLFLMLVETLRARADARSFQRQLACGRAELESAWARLEAAERIHGEPSSHRASAAKSPRSAHEA